MGDSRGPPSRALICFVCRRGKDALTVGAEDESQSGGLPTARPMLTQVSKPPANHQQTTPKKAGVPVSSPPHIKQERLDVPLAVVLAETTGFNQATSLRHTHLPNVGWCLQLLASIARPKVSEE